MSPTVRMPRDQRRTQLLETATRLFTHSGFHATSMDDIAAAAGVTKPVLYQHFDSKETLFSEVVRVTGERLVEGVAELAEVPGTTTDRVREGVTGFYRLVTEGDSLRLFTGHEAISEEVSAQVAEVLDRMAIALAQVLTASRQMTTAEARVIGHSMISLTRSTAHLLALAEDEPARGAVLDTVVVLAVRGLTGFAPLEQPEVVGTVQDAQEDLRTGTDG